ncbi:T9SS type A sorting domain-containing protein [candidate division WOR-3 bacterium]|nr:T9SS type A sorting domain-containing protein [candidate division WOR-3 bacterium]
MGFLIFALFSSNFSDTTYFRVITYNALNFSDNDFDRAGYFQTIFDSVNADIILVQEMIDEGGCDTLLNRLNSDGLEYERAEFIDGYDTDNILFYQTSKCTLISQGTIQTDLRDISEYVLKINNNEIRLYSCHLKASQGYPNEQRRLQEATKLRNWLNDSIPIGSEFIIVGDMNFYYDEPAYYKLIGEETNNNGRAEDPLEQPGDWHDNLSYADIHTQSTRDTSFGGGASGGLDDRFDFIFINFVMNDSSGIEYIEGSYRAYGNDGNHFNQSINDGVNDSVSVNVANALFYASDHLPVYADFLSLGSSGINDREIILEPSLSVDMIGLGVVKIRYELYKSNKVHIGIYNLLGQRVRSFQRNENAGKHMIIWDGEDSNMKKLSTGIYFIRFKVEDYTAVRKLFLVR